MLAVYKRQWDAIEDEKSLEQEQRLEQRAIVSNKASRSVPDRAGEQQQSREKEICGYGQGRVERVRSVNKLSGMAGRLSPA